MRLESLDPVRLVRCGVVLLAVAANVVPAAAQSSVRSGGARATARRPAPPPARPAVPSAAKPGLFPPTLERDPRLGAGGVGSMPGRVVTPGSPHPVPRAGSVTTPGSPLRTVITAPPPLFPDGSRRERRGPRTLVYPVYVPVYGFDPGYPVDYEDGDYDDEVYEDDSFAPLLDETAAPAGAGPQRIGGRSRVIEFHSAAQEPVGPYRLVALRGGLTYAVTELDIGDEVVRFTTVQGDRHVLSRAELDEEWTARLNEDRDEPAAP